MYTVGGISQTFDDVVRFVGNFLPGIKIDP